MESNTSGKQVSMDYLKWVTGKLGIQSSCLMGKSIKQYLCQSN
jgi:hypothetical protein